MVRTPFVDENGLKKGAWSDEEDNKLRSYIQRYGHWNWRELPRFAGLSRCGKSCRLRWINYLKPNVKHGSYSKEEEEHIITLHQQLGNRWSKIAKNLPGRTDNEIKNYWHTHLKKRFQQQITTKRKWKRNLTKSSESQKSQYDNNNDDNGISGLNNFNIRTNLNILESYPLSPEHSTSITESCSLNSETLSSLLIDDSHKNSATSDALVNTFSVSQYLHPISPETLKGQSVREKTFGHGGINKENTQSIRDSIGEELLDRSFWTEPFVLETYQQYDDYANFNLIDGVFSSPTMSSYWDLMDFSYIFTID